MEENVRKCINQATFGGNPLLCYRGFPPDNFAFDDEPALRNFLTLNEESKMESIYIAKNNSIVDELHMAWGLDLDFKGQYSTDYKLLQNDLVEERTSWRDKYTTVLSSISRHKLYKV